MNDQQRQNLHKAAHALRSQQHRHRGWTLKDQDQDGTSYHCAWGMAIEAARPGRWTIGHKTGATVPLDDLDQPRETYTELNDHLEELFGLNTSQGVTAPGQDGRGCPTVIQLSEEGPHNWPFIADWMDSIAAGDTIPTNSRHIPPKR